MSDLSSDQRGVVAAIEQLAARLPQEPSPDVQQRLLHEFRRRAAARRVQRRMRLAAAAAVLAFTVLGGWLILGPALDRRDPAVDVARGPAASAGPVANAGVFFQVDEDPVEVGMVIRVRVPWVASRLEDGGVLTDVWVGHDGNIKGVRVLTP